MFTTTNPRRALPRRPVVRAATLILETTSEPKGITRCAPPALPHHQSRPEKSSFRPIDNTPLLFLQLLATQAALLSPPEQTDVDGCLGNKGDMSDDLTSTARKATLGSERAQGQLHQSHGGIRRSAIVTRRSGSRFRADNRRRSQANWTRSSQRFKYGTSSFTARRVRLRAELDSRMEWLGGARGRHRSGPDRRKPPRALCGPRVHRMFPRLHCCR